MISYTNNLFIFSENNNRVKLKRDNIKQKVSVLLYKCILYIYNCFLLLLLLLKAMNFRV